MLNNKLMIGIGALMLSVIPSHGAFCTDQMTDETAPPKLQTAPSNEDKNQTAPSDSTAPKQAVKPHESEPKPTKSASWEDFHATCGNCSVKLPANPEHVSEKIQMPDSKYELRYDAFISEHNKSSVYMLLVAQYPEFVDASYAQSSLEAFLNGILSYNPANQLIFADLSLVDGHEALDFFIRAGAVYFKGRAILVKNSLYLMAMECEIQDYDENNFNMFINSFSIKH